MSEAYIAKTGVMWQMEQAARREAQEEMMKLTPGAINFMEAQPKSVLHPRYEQLHQRMRDISAAKNSDYADSQEDPLRNFRACERAGIPAFDGCLTRLSDKFERVMNLRKKERESRAVGVQDESITDTLLDLANYALIAIVLHEELTALPEPTREYVLAMQQEAIIGDPATLKWLVEKAIKEGVEKGTVSPELERAWRDAYGDSGPEEMGG